MSYAVMEDETEDRYYTQVEAGDVRLFTLDQLDAAFNAGLIHENTYVCLEGGAQWLTLAEVAGLGDEEPEPVSGPQPVPYRGVAASPSVMPAPYSSPYYVPPSIAPVVNDLSFDDFDSDMMAMKPKRRFGKVVAGLAVLSLAGLGFAVVQSGGLRGLKLPASLAQGVGQASAASMSVSNLNGGSSPSKLSEIPRTPAEAPKPEPLKLDEPKPAQAAPAAASDSAAKSDDKTVAKGDDRFSDDMKAALLNKDKKQADGQKHKKAARAAVAAKRAPGKASKGGSGTGFKAGGSAYDPLNGKL